MKLYFILPAFILAAAFISVSASAKAEYPAGASAMMPDSSATCPVTGDVISNDYVAFRYIDKNIRFCNEGCVMAFKKEPAKYSEHLKCMPCNDDDANTKISSVHDGVKYYFCSNGCKGKFDNDPKAYLEEFTK